MNFFKQSIALFFFSAVSSTFAQCPGLEPSDLRSYQKGFEFVAIAKITKVKTTGVAEGKYHPKKMEISLEKSKIFKGEDQIESEKPDFSVATLVAGKEGKKISKNWVTGQNVIVFAKKDNESGVLSADACDVIAGDRVERLSRALEKINN